MSRPETAHYFKLYLMASRQTFMSFQHSLPLFRIAAQAISPSVPHLEPIPGGLEKGNIEAKEAGEEEK